MSSTIINGYRDSHTRVINVYNCVTLCQCQIVCAPLEHDESIVSNDLQLLFFTAALRFPSQKSH